MERKSLDPKDVEALKNSKTDRLMKLLIEMDTVSGQYPSGNLVVNIAAIVARKSEIEAELGEKLDYGTLFKGLASNVMEGGVIVMTDESTTGTAVSVEFNKEIRF